MKKPKVETRRLTLGPEAMAIASGEANGDEVTREHLEQGILKLKAGALSPSPTSSEATKLDQILFKVDLLNEVVASTRYMVLALAATKPEDVQQALEKLNRHLDGMQRDIENDAGKDTPRLDTFLETVRRAHQAEPSQDMKDTTKGEIER